MPHSPAATSLSASTPDWDHLTRFARQLATAAGKAILPHFRAHGPVDVKAHETWDPVTEGDKAGERAMRALIEEHFPDHGIHGEEYGRKDARSPFTWVLDPVDGTRSFVVGMPTWATLIGLYENDTPRLGVMYQPFVDDLYVGNPQGAWHIKADVSTRLQASRVVELGHATAGNTTHVRFKGNDKQGYEALRAATKLMRCDGDAYFFALVASGHLDIALDGGLQAYDIAALIPIIRGAGGIVGCWDGKDPALGGNILAASTTALFDAACAKMTGRD
jgi:myo-inositol-1(or 4)-monophosphatase